MADTPYIPPTIPVFDLPESELRAPLRHPVQEASAPAAPIDLNELCEQLTPLISAAIARAARQRRYTP